MGSMYVGWVTPTEAAAVGCALGTAIAAIWVNSPGAPAAAFDTTIIAGSILFIVYAALVFSYAISMARIGEEVTLFIIGLGLTR